MAESTAQARVFSEVLDMINQCDICHRLSYTLIGGNDVILMLRIPTCMVKRVNAMVSSHDIIMMQDHLLNR